MEVLRDTLYLITYDIIILKEMSMSLLETK